MISVFVPSHITGFFSIMDNENPLIKGSLGAGVLLDKGVITKIDFLDNGSIDDSNSVSALEFSNGSDLNPDGLDEISNFKILINGKCDEYNQGIVLKTIELMKNDLSFNLDNVLINQEIQVPVGCGFGTSASSAIGVAICINEFFNLGLSNEDCGKYAHLAELELGTGLGDVIAEFSKGIVLRTKVGAPGYGEVKSIVPQEKFDFKKDMYENNEFYVLTKSIGEISTSSIINSPKYKKIITDIGLQINRRFQNEDDGIVIGSKFKSKFDVAFDKEFSDEETIKKFTSSSLEFAKRTHLINDDLLKIIHNLHGKVIGASMAMLGNTVFAILTHNQKITLEAERFGEFDFYKMNTQGILISKDD